MKENIFEKYINKFMILISIFVLLISLFCQISFQKTSNVQNE